MDATPQLAEAAFLGVGSVMMILMGPHTIPLLLTVALTGGSILTGLN